MSSLNTCLLYTSDAADEGLGVGTVKFTGEVLQSVKNVRYEIDMKKIMSPGGTTVGLANGIVLADNKQNFAHIYSLLSRSKSNFSQFFNKITVFCHYSL